MAKAPSAKVSKTSGQGVSRLSYQKGRSLGNKGMSSPGGVKDSAKIELKSGRGPGRPKKDKADGKGGINISYGDTLPISTLKDVQEYGKGKR